MSKTPGTVSKILWHFTGGPQWDNKLNKQNVILKNTAYAYKILDRIIEEGILKTGSYSEVVQTLVYSGPEDGHKTIQTRPVCCLADIPIQHLGYHSKRYGKIAIGFHRDSVQRQFNPVLYNPIGSYVNCELGMLHDWINDETVYKLKRTLRNLGIIENTHNEDVFILIDEIQDNLDICAQLFVDVLTYSKSFDPSKEFETIYCEREWRSTDDFHFIPSDVAMVVLPRRGGHYKRFVEEHIDLLKHFSVVAWEDLIEH